MALEKGKITTNQLFFLFVNFLVSTSLVFTVGIEAKQDSWIAVLLGIGFSLGLALVYFKLANRFPGQTLIAINDQVWGPVLGKLFSGILILFYILVCFLTVNLTVRFQKEFLLNTPPLVLALLGIGISIYLVSHGLEVLARCSQIIRIFISIIWGFIFLLGVSEFKAANFQPVLQTPFPLLLKAALRVSAFTFSTGSAFLMIFPMMRDSLKIQASIVKAFAFSGIFLLTGVIFTIGVLGPAAEYYTFPLLSASRIINIGEIFTRMEVLMGIIAWLGSFMLQTIIAYGLFTATGELLKLKSYQILNFPLGILLALFSVRSFGSSSEDVEFGLKVYTWLSFPFQYIISLLTLGVAAIRNLPREER